MFEGIEIKVLDVLSAIAIFAAGLIVAYIVRTLMRRSLAPRVPLGTYKPLENLAFYSIVGTAIVLALYPLGLNLSSLIVAGGLASLAVGLAAQNSLGNLISGIFLLIEQPLRVGDPVSIGNVSGVVTNVSLLSTTIRTWDGTIVRIPNNTVFGGEIVNYQRTRARRVEFTIGVHYKTSVGKAIETIRELLDKHPYCLVNPAPEVYVEEYADSSVNLRVRCWAPPQVWFATKVDLMTRLKDTLESAGIEIPYPQLDLHLRTAEAPLKVEVKREGEPT